MQKRDLTFWIFSNYFLCQYLLRQMHHFRLF
jgi:hypothetical protein